MKSRRVLLMSLIALAVGVMLRTSAATAGASDDGNRVLHLLAQSRAALGGAALDRHTIVQLDGTIKADGLTGTQTVWAEIGGRRFAERSATPPIVSADGFDGNVVWNADGTGLVWVDGGVAGRSGEISSVFVTDQTLWRIGNGGAVITWGGERSANGTGFDALTVTAPGSAVPFDLWFDRATHLPVRFVQTIGPDSTTQTYADYHVVNDGLMIPFAVHVESSDGNSSDEKILHASVNPPDGDARLAKPASAANDFSIAGDARQTSVPFEFADNHVYIQLMLNGKGPYQFVLDTGGANIVDPAVAKEIGATGSGSAQGGGVGSTTESLSFAAVDSMTIGDATLRKQIFLTTPTRSGFGVGAGRPVDGLIGFEVLSRFVTTFDYAHKSLVLQMPATAVRLAGARLVPFVLNGRQPQFGCAIDGIAAQCTLDTGARDSISLMSPFIAAHPEIAPATLSAPGVTGFGFGGAANGRLGRLQSVSIDNFALPRVIADFSTQEKGAFAAPFLAGNVGGNLLRRFLMQLDYGNSTMALVANAAYDEPEAFDRSGLFLLRRNGGIVVLDVRPGTPAEAAGLHAGDRLDSIDGVEATSLGLQAVRERFLGAPGTQLHLAVTPRTGTARTVTLTLRDYV